MPLRFDLTKLGDEHCDVRALAFDRSGSRLVTGGAAAAVFALGEARVEHAVELNLYALDRNTSAMVEAIEFSPDGGTVAARFGGHSGSNGFEETWLYDASDGALWHVYGGVGPDGGGAPGAGPDGGGAPGAGPDGGGTPGVGPDGSGEPGTGPAGDAPRGAGRALALEYFAEGLVHGQLWTPDGSRRIARAPAREAVVREPATGREFVLRAPLPFRPLAFAPGGARLVAFSGPVDGADDTVLWLGDVDGGRLERVEVALDEAPGGFHGPSAYPVGLSPEGDAVFWADTFGRLLRHALADGRLKLVVGPPGVLERELGEVFEEMAEGVSEVDELDEIFDGALASELSPDGRLWATTVCSADAETAELTVSPTSPEPGARRRRERSR